MILPMSTPKNHERVAADLVQQMKDMTPQIRYFRAGADGVLREEAPTTEQVIDADPGPEEKVCPRCEGRGEVAEKHPRCAHMDYRDPACDIIEGICPDCGGDGISPWI